MPYFPWIISAVVLILENNSGAKALKRTVGPVSDLTFANLSRECNGSDPELFKWGKCPGLINCVYSKMEPNYSLGTNIGSNIAGLLPTILVLIGAPPLELLQTAILSPHRALATCCFTIGLPVTLFRQLRPLDQQLAQLNPLDPRVRKWKFSLSSLSKGPTKASKKHVLFKIVADMVILILTGIMVWKNISLNSYVMVSWRCEYSFLVIAWPAACVAWLLFAVSLLFIMKEEIVIHNTENPHIRYSIWKLMTLPYTLNMKPTSNTDSPQTQSLKSTNILLELREGTGPGAIQATICSVDMIQLEEKNIKSVIPVSRSEKYVSKDHSITVEITMPTDFGLRSWRTLETCIEIVAVGVYLYATFTLMSLTFLSSEKAMVFATQMAICLSLVRIFGLLF
ncbi:hypothetical protein LOZ12_003907 [Ophidiomyces ophidiicola]|uniref:Uncharacterized protein n=1 Tax=Ophidiomyces ophidiicola TaxID=1387563 RepID=A0ACB8UVR4_9EURO|nr:uncharacterized protein LOZ57_006442 [Ophidiomyces ophidiicola]KAI1909912.1 hypothetical protein LOZ61_004749 [Ophidiomyces ophidiicola]KAI1924058.1 hypothetical protein LOZ64_000800 [Ophidiomyces ophidiicola]KAI1925066.1 hypothetical protein LOZ60_004345 [Ophidiomyces ophidiicola]KAI1937893.1 hypothetical protein LOZ57_006442 [Ophidiomyces ophidiicola]KAI1944611.1 hypothetical protein LOZ62_004106 [Ophidiomyces ophidiicola]